MGFEELEAELEEVKSLSDDEFGARCRAARAYSKKTLEDMQELLDISRQALARRESGAVRVRPIDRLMMARAYCSVTDWPLRFFTEERLFAAEKDESPDYGALF